MCLLYLVAVGLAVVAWAALRVLDAPPSRPSINCFSFFEFTNSTQLG